MNIGGRGRYRTADRWCVNRSQAVHRVFGGATASTNAQLSGLFGSSGSTDRIEVPARTADEPRWMVGSSDLRRTNKSGYRKATRLGVTRQSLIKVWIAEKLDHGNHTAAQLKRNQRHEASHS